MIKTQKNTKNDSNQSGKTLPTPEFGPAQVKATRDSERANLVVEFKTWLNKWHQQGKMKAASDVTKDATR